MPPSSRVRLCAAVIWCCMFVGADLSIVGTPVVQTLVDSMVDTFLEERVKTTYSYSTAMPDVAVGQVCSGDALLAMVDFSTPLNCSTSELVGAPFIMSAVVGMFNVHELNGASLKMSQKTLVGIMLGTIEMWNSPELISDNPHLSMLSNISRQINVIWTGDSGRMLLLEQIFGSISNSTMDDWVYGQWPSCLELDCGEEELYQLCSATADSFSLIDYSTALYYQEHNIVLFENYEGNFISVNANAITSAVASCVYPCTKWPLPDFTNLHQSFAWPFPIIYSIVMHKNLISVTCQEFSAFMELLFNSLTSTSFIFAITSTGFVPLSGVPLQMYSVSRTKNAMCNGSRVLDDEIFVRITSAGPASAMLLKTMEMFSQSHSDVLLKSEPSIADAWKDELLAGTATNALTVDGSPSIYNQSDSRFTFLPVVTTGLVVSYNIPELELFNPNELVLSMSIVLEILLGNIDSWSDSAIKGLQSADVANLLPDEPIFVVTFGYPHENLRVLNAALSALSPEWKMIVGNTPTADSWPILINQSRLILVSSETEFSDVFLATPYSMAFPVFPLATLGRWQFSRMLVNGTVVLANISTIVKSVTEPFSVDLFQSKPEAWPLPVPVFLAMLSNQSSETCNSYRMAAKYWLWIFTNFSGATNNLFRTIFSNSSEEVLCKLRCNGNITLQECLPVASVKGLRFAGQVLICVFGIVTVLGIATALGIIYFIRKRNPVVPYDFCDDKIGDVEISDIKLVKKIGEGESGIVSEAIWQGTTHVAVKQFKNKNEEIVQREAVLLSKLRHPNIITFLGVAKLQGTYVIVTELAEGPVDRLICEWDKRALLSNLLHIAKNAAAGMCYLFQSRIIHGDLALRNILYHREGDHISIKISDFERGMLSNCRAKMTCSFPIRWTAPEVLHSLIPTHMSDVWSFGVVLWELFSPNELPFQNVPLGDIMTQVSDGARPKQPPRCPDELFALMTLCWSAEPSARPLFQTIYNELVSEEQALYEAQQPSGHRKTLSNLSTTENESGETSVSPETSTKYDTSTPGLRPQAEDIYVNIAV
ncbi:serine/threonine kinase [Pelomyxa schiedti]|nr:serine/threonine kinase [Pelomyxa schiedti]